MNKFNKIILVVLTFFQISFHISASAVFIDKPISTDSRIRTLVFTEHEVFRIVVHYGYQTNIEFSKKEEIQNISVGNNYAWQLSPLNNRLFIKPLEENIMTNMTVITNKRTYQFELQSKDMAGITDSELVYVVRFFYPDEYQDVIAPTLSDEADVEPIPILKPYNFNYKVEGDENFAPSKIFDDGIVTYLKMPSNVKDNIVIKAENAGEMRPVVTRKMQQYTVVDTISKSFEIICDNKKVKIINNNFIMK